MEVKTHKIKIEKLELDKTILQKQTEEFRKMSTQGGDSGGPGRGCHGSSTFLRSKNRKGKQRKKKIFKAETIKRLLARSKCYCFNYSSASRIQKFSCRPNMVANNTFQSSISPPLRNPFRRPWY